MSKWTRLRRILRYMGWLQLGVLALVGVFVGTYWATITYGWVGYAGVLWVIATVGAGIVGYLD